VEEGLLCWGFGRICGGGLRGQASISVGGALKGPHFPGTYVLKKALEMDTFLHRGPVKNHRGSFHRKLRDS